MSTVNGMQRTTQVRGNYAKSVAEKREDAKMTHSSSEPTTRLAHFAKIAAGIFVAMRIIFKIVVDMVAQCAYLLINETENNKQPGDEMNFTETIKIDDENGRLVNVDRTFEIDTTPEALRAEFAEFQPQHEIDNGFWTKERQFARIKMYEWRETGNPIGDGVHAQIIAIIS